MWNCASGPYRTVRYGEASKRLSPRGRPMRAAAAFAGGREWWAQRPLRERVALLWFCLAVALDFGCILFGRGFFVSPAYVHAFFWPSVVGGLLYGTVRIGVGTGPTVPGGSDTNQPRPKRPPILILVGLLLVIGSLLGSIPLAVGVPWITNYAIGKPYELKTVVLQKIRIGRPRLVQRILFGRLTPLLARPGVRVEESL